MIRTTKMCSLTTSILSIASTAFVVPWLTAQDGYSSAAMSRTRYLAEHGRIPLPDEIVVEEILNYHRHAVPRPKAGCAVAMELRWGRGAFNLDDPRAVLQIGLATTLVHDRSDLPPLNLALVIDKSGSMSAGDKMPRVKDALMTMLGQLRPCDVVSIVTYDDEARVALPACELGDGRAARGAISAIQPGGSTNLHGGLMLGCEQVRRHYRARATNRVILLTDGIANRGVTDPEAIARDAIGFNDLGVDVSTIGVGLEIQKDVLRRLAERGRGLYHFVAGGEDIDKVFVRELQCLIAPVARDVRLEIEHDPALRLSGMYGYRPRRERGRTVLDLPDMNLGLTQVIVTELRLCGDPPPRRALPVAVRLTYHDEASGQRVVLAEESSLAIRSAGGESCGVVLDDPEVQKNHTIAVLAAAMRDMAESCAAGRDGEALRSLHAAVATAYGRFPHMADRDVARVTKMAGDYVRLLEARCRPTELRRRSY